MIKVSPLSFVDKICVNVLRLLGIGSLNSFWISFSDG